VITSNKKVLFAVLNWGLGHATRSIPVIQSLLANKVQVVIAGDGDSFALLKDTFPNLKSYELPALEVNYSNKIPLAIAMLSFIPKFLKNIDDDTLAINTIIQKENPNAIISDHRYGARSTSIPSILIAHQLRIQVPSYLKFLEEILWKKHLKYLKKFDEIWIPDVEGENNLAGDLAHHPCIKSNLNVHFIGSLSRLMPTNQNSTHKKYDLICLLSGPEPQRSILENKFIEQAKNLPLKSLLIQGKPQSQSVNTIHSIDVKAYANQDELSALMMEDSIFVTRSGYSTLMDLAKFAKKAIVVPTPGQTEQLYLGKYHHELKHVICQDQNGFDLNLGIKELNSLIPFTLNTSNLLDKTTIKFISEKL
jgi:predicted glycosyltransferase